LFAHSSVEWDDFAERSILVQANGTVAKAGDIVTWDGRDDVGVLITEIFGIEKGPIGFTYLPWRGERWASLAISLRGDRRFIVCLPHGINKFGLHIDDWSTFRKVDHPDAEHPDFKAMVASVTKK